MPEAMRDSLMEASKNSGRSMNAEIVARLQASLQTKPARADTMTRIEEHLARLGQAQERMEKREAELLAQIKGRATTKLL